jgi:hypothetical protein
MIQLENLLDPMDYELDKTEDQRAAVIVDFMSLIRKIRFEKFSKIREGLECAWSHIITASNANRVDIVYDSYLENSVKEAERMRRYSNEPIEIVNLNLDSVMPVEIDKFWASPTNKEKLQILSRNFFINKAKESGKNVVLSGYVTDKEGICSALEIRNQDITHRHDLDCMAEEADCRLILHIAKAGEEHFTRILVLSNDTDVVIYNLAYYDKFKMVNIEKIWIRYGLKEKVRNIPIHWIADILGTDKSLALLKAHVLTGCDVTSKVGSKAAALKAEPEIYLKDFGEEPITQTVLQQAEKYLVKVTKPNASIDTFDDLRYMMYTSKNKTLSDLPPTSSTIEGHLLRSHYFISVCLGLLDITKENPQPLNYGWRLSNGLLVPEQRLLPMPVQFTITCGCSKGCKKGCSCRKQEELCTEYCKCQSCENMN